MTEADIIDDHRTMRGLRYPAELIVGLLASGLVRRRPRIRTAPLQQRS